MHYQNKQLLTQKLGNNTFAWDERIVKYGQSPTLTIPALIDGTIDDVKIGSEIIFEEIENEEIRSCVGLENFVWLRHCDEGNNPVDKKDVPNNFPGSLHTSRGQTQPEIIVFDNHNHALYFWIDAVRRGLVETGFELIHIDEHSDLWENNFLFDLDEAMLSKGYAWDFTNLSCNVGNYILPAIESGLVGNMIRIENEYQIDAYMDYIPSENSVMNLDLDIFATELDHIPEEKKIKIIRNLLKRVKYITIATSPYFIEQGRAIEYLHRVLRG